MIGFDNIAEAVLPACARLEYRLASPGVLALALAAVIGLHAVWTGLHNSGLNLLRDPRYKELLERLRAPEGDRVDPTMTLVETEKLFRSATVVWTCAAVLSISAMAVVPMDLPKDGARPTLHFWLFILVLGWAVQSTVRASLRRMALDRSLHAANRKTDNDETARRNAA